MDSENDCPRKEEFNKVDWSVDHTPRVSCLTFFDLKLLRLCIPNVRFVFNW